MKTTSNLFKHALILLSLLGWASFATGQTSPEITIEKKVDGAYENYNLYEGTTNILAGQKDTFKIIISEPNDALSGFFSHDGQLKVFLPDDPGDLRLHNDILGLNEPSAGSDFSYLSLLPNLSTNNDTTYIDVGINNHTQESTITIENLIIEFPDDLADGDDFELKAWADFMDTDDDGAADTTEFELVNFKYTKPLLSITKQSTACYGEKVVCDLDITPAGLAYELVGSLNNGKMVKDGDELEFEYNDVVHLLDTG